MDQASVNVSRPAVSTDSLPFGEYRCAPGHYDEIYAQPGVLRPHWKRFVALTKHFGPDEFARRWGQTQRLLQQNSLSYAVPLHPPARKRPWALDAFPLLVPEREWKTVSAGLRQRAKLFDLILRDLYGPQRLLRERILPAEIVYRHPGFLLPYCGQNPALGRFLHLYSADLARSADGRWWVLADYTEAPAGAGYALENRIALSRMLPDVFRQCHVERLAQYFFAVCDEFARLGPQGEDNPRVVILSEEAGSPHFFEDAYLARYLGYTLVEAGDLAVRNNQVFLKTLGGLSKIDVLVRRPASDECDPLELSDRSAFGVAGLMQSVHSRTASIANALGSGLVESPVFMAFLPQLCQTLLGEPPAIPGVATWWCGDPEFRRYVISRIDELDIRPAYRWRDRELHRLSKDELIARIEANPAEYVGQERVARSMAPIWSDDGPRTAYAAIRGFAVANGKGYTVMQGGLARVTTSPESLDWLPRDAELSKDTCVLADGPVMPFTLLRASEEVVTPQRSGAGLPSRVAENLYWLGRFVERADSSARLLRTVCQRLASEEDIAHLTELPLLLRVLAEKGQIEPGFVVAEIAPLLPAIEGLLPITVFDEEQTGSLRSTVSKITRSASNVRDRLSLDSWRTLRQMDEEFWPGTSEPDLADTIENIDVLLVKLWAFTGLVMESMTRAQTWHFLDLGRRLERALQTVNLIRIMLKGPGATDHSALEALLEVADSIMTYRSRYGSVQLAPVLDLLLTDETNPRSVAYQLTACRERVNELPRDAKGSELSTEQQLAEELSVLIRSVNSQELAKEYLAGRPHVLNSVFDKIEATLPKLSDAVSHKYLIHTGPTQRLAEIDVTNVE